MKHRIQTAIATLALIFTTAASPMLCAQTAATPQSENIRAAPKITVESGKPAAIQINGNPYTITPTILDGSRVELKTSITGFTSGVSLVSLDAVATTDIKVLMERIEHTIFLRAFEKVTGEIYQAQFDFHDEPLPGEDTAKQAKRVEQQNAKLRRLNDLRERLRWQILDEARETTTAK